LTTDKPPMKPKPAKKPKPRKQPKKSPISKQVGKETAKRVYGKPFEKGHKITRLGSKNYKEAYEAVGALMAQEVEFPGGVKRYLTGRERIAFRRWYFALEGGIQWGQRAMDAIENRVDGLPVQAIKNIGSGTGKVNINIVRTLKEGENPNIEVKSERTEPVEPQNPK